MSLDPKAGTSTAVGVAYKSLPKDVRAGDTLLLNDGQIVLDVTGVSGPRIDYARRRSAASCPTTRASTSRAAACRRAR